MHEMAAGWYADPWVAGQQRYWDGTAWTSDVFADAAAPVPDPHFAAQYGPPPTTPADPPAPPPVWQQPVAVPPPTVSAPAAPPPAGLSNRTVGLIAGAALLALALLAGAILWLRPDAQPVARPQTTPTPSASPVPTPSPTPTPSPSDRSRAPGPGPSGSPSPGQQPSVESVLERLVVRQQDVPARFRVGVIPGGRSATDQPTLDLCSGQYPSESQRIGRLQVAARDRGGSTTLSTEAVQYASAEATAQAFAEVDQVAAACSGEIGLDGTNPVRTSVTGGADRGWGSTPGVERLAYTVADTDLLTGAESQQAVVFLRRGPLFIGLYFPNAGGRQMPVEGKTSIPDIVRVFEKRLLDTPPGDPAQAPPPDSSSPADEPPAGGGVGA